MQTLGFVAITYGHGGTPALAVPVSQSLQAPSAGIALRNTLPGAPSPVGHQCRELGMMS